MKRIRRRRDENRRPVEVDHLQAPLGRDAAWHNCDLYQVERMMNRPEEHVRIVVGAGESAVARAHAHRIQGARAGRRPQLGVERGIAERSRRRGRARGRKDHPAALAPCLLIDRRIGSPRPMRRDVARHLILGGDRELPQIGERPDVGRLEFRGFELRAIERAVLVKIRKHRAELFFLDIADMLARRTFKLRGPVTLARRLAHRARELGEHGDPSISRVEFFQLRRSRW